MGSRVVLQDYQNGLTPGELERLSSIFAEDKSPDRSDAFVHYPTYVMLEKLYGKGYVATWATEAQTRIEGHAGHTKHMIRLRRRSDLATQGIVPEALLINASDGGASLRILQGYFRGVCENGCVSGDYNQIRVFHRGNVVDNVVEGSIEVIEDSEEMMADIDAMRQVMLSPQEQLVLAESALSLRFHLDDEEEVDSCIWHPEDLLKPRRTADAPDRNGNRSLLVTGQVIQEQCVKGTKGRMRRYNPKTHQYATIRSMNGIEESVDFNKKLHLLEKKMLELKLQA